MLYIFILGLNLGHNHVEATNAATLETWLQFNQHRDKMGCASCWCLESDDDDGGGRPKRRRKRRGKLRREKKAETGHRGFQAQADHKMNEVVKSFMTSITENPLPRVEAALAKKKDLWGAMEAALAGPKTR